MESRAPYGKSERLSIRVSEKDKRTLEAAAKLTGLSASTFIVREALEAAEMVLADQTLFVLPPDEWDAFVEMLDRPARELPQLKAALSKPSPFSER